MNNGILRLVKILPTITIFILFFLATLYTPKDFDLGWHLKYGEYFVQNFQILNTNIYSTTMVNYPWISSSWLLDPVIYVLFTRFGFAGLSIVGAFVTAAMLIIMQRGLKTNFWQTALLGGFLFYYLNPVADASIRGQTVSLLFLTILLTLLVRLEQGKQTVFRLLPLLFIAWTNTHTQYSLGLAVLGIWLALSTVRQYMEKREIKVVKPLLLISMCAAATLINPRGSGIFVEILRHFNNPSQKAIIEWLPFARNSILWRQFFGLHIVLELTFLALFWKQKFIRHLPWIGSTAVLMIATWWMRRYAWSLVVTAPFLLIPLIQMVRLSAKETRILSGIATVSMMLSIGWLITTKLPKENIFTMSWDRYCAQTVNCSAESARYLIENQLTTNLWTFYGYGGWLIGNFPEIKPGMDGRMPSWVDESGYSEFSKYYRQEQNIEPIDEDHRWDVVYTIIEKPIYNQMQKLVDAKRWEQVYEDDVAAIFVRNKTR